MLKLLDFPFPSFDSPATAHVFAAEYLFWPALSDDGSMVSVYVRRTALEDVLGLILPSRIDPKPGDVHRASLLRHRARIEKAANRLEEAGISTGKIFLEPPTFRLGVKSLTEVRCDERRLAHHLQELLIQE
jgi:hypothetical protein